MIDPFLDAAVARGGDLVMGRGCYCARVTLGGGAGWREVGCACIGGGRPERMPVRQGLLTILFSDLIEIANQRMAETTVGRA